MKSNRRVRAVGAILMTCGALAGAGCVGGAAVTGAAAAS
jgi:hypothetical protein